MGFHGRVALVTGAGGGLGRAAARRLVSLGAQVAAVDADEEALSETAAGHPAIRTWELDVSDCDALEAVVREVESELGAVDRVVNAAGIAPATDLLEQNVDEIQRVMELNFGGAVNLAQATLPRMAERGQGDWIQIASFAGWAPLPSHGAYSVSQAALVALSELLRREVEGKGIRVVCACLSLLGAVETDRVLEAVEVALERGRLWVFGSRRAALVWRLRRLLPGARWDRLAWRALDP